MAILKKKPNIMLRRGLVKRGVPLEANASGKPLSVWRVQPELVISEKAPRQTPSFKKAVKIGQQVMRMENIARKKAGQPKRVIFEPEFVRKLRVVNVDGEKLHIHPSGYLPYIKALRYSEKELTPKLKLALAKRGRLLSSTPFLIGAGAAVLSLGSKYIIIPKRPMTVGVHPGKFHCVAGMSDYYRYAKGKRHELPHETASREAMEEVGGKFETMSAWFSAEKVAKEIGAAKEKIQFLGQELKPVSQEKAPPLILLQDLNINMFEIQHAVDIKMQNPDEFIEKNFRKVSDFNDGRLKSANYGIFEFRKDAAVEDKWEMQQAAIIPRSSKGIFYFLKENRGNVTEAARLGLLAYAAELRRIGK